MYAAENDGKLPAKLDDVNCRCPWTQLPASRSRISSTAARRLLRGTPPVGREKEAAYNVRYEVTVAK